MALASIVGSRAARPLTGAWAIACMSPGEATSPDGLAALRPDWIPCDGALPAAAALRAAGLWDLDRPRDFDASDWWYRCHFSAGENARPRRLRFEGLATIADVWLNGTHLLRSDNMFLAHTVDVSRIVSAENDLLLRFHALGPLFAGQSRRPRAKWRTRLVEHQALRWHRTSLLGRMPSWCPPVAPVGPWRPILIETSPLEIEDARVSAELDGGEGVVRLALRARYASQTGRDQSPLDPATVEGTLTAGTSEAPLICERISDIEFAFTATAPIPRPERWWPHTHGPQPLYGVRATIRAGAAPTTVDETIDFGHVGFRTIDADRGPDGRGFGLIVNGEPVFCRGVCWTPLDLASLAADRSAYRAALEQLRDAGVNTIRIGGTMAYETADFHDLCDQFGILLWQDLMFASMDYPWSDEPFARSVAVEATQILAALQSRPSLAVMCGSSEVDQQAAMLGLPPAQWSTRGGDELLSDLVQAAAPGTVWVPTTPTGGTLPFQADCGVSHYYGVGAYRRPFEDARRAGVRFAAECLAFANVPDPATVASILASGEIPTDRPAWKAAVPRDSGADWDFEDIRDHYVEQLFGVRASDLCRRDPERYLAVGRVATGETMLRTFAEWRRPGSTCRGGLVWFARDLQPGAGWGVIDSTGRPKASYWYLKRALAPIAVVSADEGLNGLWLHALNDTQAPVDADLRIARYRKGIMYGEPARTAIHIPARGFRSVHADALFDGFLDLTYAYRFGPPESIVVVSSLRDRATGALLSVSHYFPGLLPFEPGDLGLTAHAEPTDKGYALVLETERYAHAVAIEIDGFLPDDNYLSLEPGEARRIGLRPLGAGGYPGGSVRALNADRAVAVAAAEAISAR